MNYTLYTYCVGFTFQINKQTNVVNAKVQMDWFMSIGQQKWQ